MLKIIAIALLIVFYFLSEMGRDWMTFVKLTDTNGKPLLLKVELIESVKVYVFSRLYSLNNVVEEEEYVTGILLTNGHEYTVEETVEEILEVLNEKNNDWI